MKNIVNIPFKKANRIKTFGNSMYPLLIDGDIVYIKRASYKDISVNDIIIFQRDQRFITHRVIYKQESYLLTKGDNNLKTDGRVYKKDIIGKLQKVKRGAVEFNPEVFYQLQSDIYLKEIKTIIRLFKKNSIDYVFLKGLPLHLYYEKNIPRRLYADCDILINQVDFDSVRKIFLKAGYTVLQNALTDSKNNSFGECGFYKKVNNVFVFFDIHVEPVFMMTQINVTKELYSESFMKEMTKEFLKSKGEITIDQITYPILNPSNLIVYLCLHFFHHNFKGSFRLHFIHTIIKGEKHNKDIWKEVSVLVKKFKLYTYVYPVLLLLNTYYKTQIPRVVIKQVSPTSSIQQSIAKKFVSDSFFNDESRLFGGIHRLFLLTVLSPNSLLKKFTLIFNIEVWQLFFPIVQKILLFPFKKTKQSFQN